ncbi:helix-turn-helix domain-containing protein [Serratia fonticola]|uniref:winged helix-turn-helix domain-containing protein n=1 Tax=Serratia fonticola TaxID=47917 RepID=UPI001378E08D|nr:helix-turn-helix domain-containing protein [Serratia fonticola]NBJ36917.1 helix-turn-helix domain-containing protein [Serratia fonticola]
MKYKLFGFLINNDIQLDIANRRLTRIYTTSDKSVFFATVTLNETMVRLLVCLLENARHQEVSKEHIIKSVWDEQDHFSSNQRLWQVIKELKLKLEAIGLPRDFIFAIKGIGYSLSNKVITPLLYEHVTP